MITGTPLNSEVLATLPVDKRRGMKCELKIIKITMSTGAVVSAIGIFPENNPEGLVIGMGPSQMSALSDAQDTLQMALDSVDAAILKRALVDRNPS